MPEKEGDRHFVHRSIVQYVAVRTFLPEKLCATASPLVRESVDDVVRRFRSRQPELVRLAEASPLFEDANADNRRTVGDFARRSPEEHDEACLQLREEIDANLKADQAYFETWTRELQRPLRGADR